MKKLCIILSTSYGKGCPGFFNAEVQQDSAIVRETLRDHQLIEITIPAIAGHQSSQRKIRQILNLLDLNVHTQCHIVLNTHGSPGYSDLKHQSIIQLVGYLSRMNIEITQISALQCEGMKRLEGRLNLSNRYKTSLTESTKIISKDANLHSLQKKLTALTLNTSQHFKIRGFDEAYAPLEHKLEIANLLKGISGSELDVDIPSKSILNQNYFYQIIDGVEQLLHQEKIPKKTYQKLANFFSKIQNDMKESILWSIYSHQEIPKDSELWPLWQALSEHADQTMQHFDAKNPLHIESVYKSWLKTNKLYSFERLNIFKEFAYISLKNLQNEKNDESFYHLKNP